MMQCKGGCGSTDIMTNGLCGDHRCSEKHLINSIPIHDLRTKIKYVLVDYAFIIPVKESELDHVLELLRLADPNITIIIEDKIEDTMRYAKLDGKRLFGDW